MSNREHDASVADRRHSAAVSCNSDLASFPRRNRELGRQCLLLRADRDLYRFDDSGTETTDERDGVPRSDSVDGSVTL